MTVVLWTLYYKPKLDYMDKQLRKIFVLLVSFLISGPMSVTYAQQSTDTTSTPATDTIVVDPIDTTVIDPIDTVVIADPIDTIESENGIKTISVLNEPDGSVEEVTFNVPDSVDKPVIKFDVSILQDLFGSGVFDEMTESEIDSSIAWYFKPDNSLKRSSDWLFVNYGRECPVSNSGKYQAEILDENKAVVAVTDVIAVALKSVATSDLLDTSEELTVVYSCSSVKVNTLSTIKVFTLRGLLVAQTHGTDLDLTELSTGNYIVVTISKDTVNNQQIWVK